MGDGAWLNDTVGVQLAKAKMWKNNLCFSTNELQEKKRGRGNLYSKRFKRHIS